jgi:hypothetical protein
MRRKRFGSFPIVRLPKMANPADPPIIPIVRAGNTSPETVGRLVQGCFPESLTLHTEEKVGHKRHEYESPFADPQQIQADLLRASIEVGVPDID